MDIEEQFRYYYFFPKVFVNVVIRSSSLIQTYVIKFCAIFQTVLEANEYTDGVWIGSNSRNSPFAGDSYSQWKFYDGSDLSQCYDKDCESGEGKSSKS